MRPIIIHVGPHKTGSTTIQRSLDGNRVALEREGFAIPDIGGKGVLTLSHEKLSPGVKGRSVSADPAWSEVMAIARASPAVQIL